MVYYCKGDYVVAIATLMRDPLAADFANLMAKGEKLRKEDIKKDWNLQLSNKL